jgi:hypothetical protein
MENVMRLPAIAALALAITACGGDGQNNEAAAANAAAPAGTQVAALSEGERNAVFIRAIRDAGLDCQHVERSVSAGTAQNMPLWRAACQGGADYLIAIGADGTAQILPSGNPLDGNQAGANAGAAGNGQ